MPRRLTAERFRECLLLFSAAVHVSEVFCEGHLMTEQVIPHPPLLKMDGISKSFPGVKALQSVHLDVHSGECVALMGENGAGKSTLMKILSGVYAPEEGVI